MTHPQDTPPPLADAMLGLDLGVVRVAVACAAPLRAAFADAVQTMGFDAASASVEADASLTVQTVSALGAPPDAPPVVTYDPRALVFRDPEVEGGWRLRSPGIESRLEGRRGRIQVAPEAYDGEMLWHLITSLQVLARARHAFPLHAAAVVHGGQGVLVVGPSDVGKSTLAYTLVRSGWSFLTDDAVLLTPTPAGGVAAVGFRRRFGLDADGPFPHLAAHAVAQASDADKWSVDVAALYPAQALRRTAPRLLVFPTLTGRARSAVAEMTPSDAYIALLQQSGQRVLADAYQASHHDVLARLVGQARAVRLEAGLDLRDEPGAAAALLARELRGVPTADADA